MPYAEVLKKAIERNKQDQRKTVVTATKSAPPPPSPSSVASPPAVIIVPVSSTASVKPVMPALPTTPLPPQKPSTSTSQKGLTEEERILRYGKAVLKLKSYRSNLKYALWEYQDGKTLEEASSQYNIPLEALRYSISHILEESGETVEQFKENRSDEWWDRKRRAASANPSYTERLREAVFAFKQKKMGSLYGYASHSRVSIFDLADELIKELEIESKLYRLQPVDVAHLPKSSSNNPPPTSITASTSSIVLPPHIKVITTGAPTVPAIPAQITPLSHENTPQFPLPPEALVGATAGPPPAAVTAAAAAVAAATAAAANASSSPPSHVHPHPLHLVNDDAMLSDIDEVIRGDDTVTLNAAVLASNNNVEAQEVGDAVILINICGVCSKVFTDEKIFREHEQSGCIDFDQ